MKLLEMYHFFINEGMKADLRKKTQIDHFLSEKKRAYKQLKAFEKKVFDKEMFSNPYSDTRILYGLPQTEIKTILVGIDIDVGEILLADRLRAKGQKIDLVLGHHPHGRALACLDDVMNLQTDVLINLGVHKDVAQDLMRKRTKEVGRKVHGSNHMQSLDAAKLLDIPFLCCHTPADNHVASYLQKIFDRKKPKKLQNIVNLLLKEKEYQLASFENAGPQIVLGKPQDAAGRVFVDMTGGTSGAKEIYPRLSQLGIKTQVGMHISENHFSKMQSEYMQTIIAGHIASDSLGLNLLLDKLQKKTDVKIIECSGFRRVRRK